MSTVLTENIVLSRTRQHDLSRVRKLNCWGSELSDVSIVERMPYVEVLSLTINNITTLRHFGGCKNLQELYLRKNKIPDLNELYYIQELPNLKKLTLNENPCAEHPNYRYTVLRALPYLELLDNVPVTSEEVYKAQTLGNEISDPTIEPPPPPPPRPHAINGNQQHHVQQQNNQLSTESTQLTTQNHEEEDYSYEVYEEEAAEINQEENVQYRENSRNDLDKQSLHGTAPVASQVSSAASSEASQSPRLKHKQANQSQRHSLPVSSSSPTDTNHDEWKENNTKQATTPVNSSSSSSSSSMPSILIPSRRYGFQSIQQLASNQHKALSKGGKNRNANILSAVLCLIKELDYASLEVAETHIHCRMEEMEEQG
ncbi:uncharacterized protein LOC141852047 [Brevipalpus obovatus]|uniref:uncharacterized protein LOC141852047 n=1 Tax=Brevipalpus obovatus TaxID=246614 RepID=UPI003D9F13D6